MDYKTLVEVYEEIEKTSKRLAKTYFISNLLKKTPVNDLQRIILLLRGKLFPEWDKSKIGVAGRLVLKSIAAASGAHNTEIENLWRELGDLGLVAEKVIQNKTQITLFQKNLTVEKVFSNLQKIATIEGMGSVDRKTKLISELLSNATPKEAKYIVRTVLEDLRVGIGSSTMRDAIVWAFLPIDINFDSEKISIDVDREEYNKMVEIIQSALDKSNDFGVVARAATVGISELEKVTIIPGNPIKVMLAQKENNIDDAFKRVGTPAVIEFKYDGFRMQIHKFQDQIKIFTRRLEEVTKQFPEVVKYVQENIGAEEFIIDCEAVGYDSKTEKYLVFQHISQRIRRKYDIEQLAQKLPVEINVFDILFYNGENLLKRAFKDRRVILEKIVKEKKFEIILSHKLITSSKEEAMKFYDESVRKGNEGIMVKNIEGIYKPGSRVGTWIKVKSTMDTLDLVIVSAEWGEGKRSGWFTSFTLACIDDDGNLLEIGKVGTGVKEKAEEGLSFGELTELLKPLIKTEKGREVTFKPEIVLEIQFEEIQKSPTYSSGYALRFPRVKTLREDRSPEDACTLDRIKEEFEAQKKS
ncbi:MAG: ATP-dependent DNA ligase [Nanoarchaeota archaeon]|nr:ATP-dependent DNA ligase [Nanoarchaeota archaeon]